jgi:uncharacterized membrane protein
MKPKPVPSLLSALIIAILAMVFSLDLFLHRGEPATFDSPIHITNMVMYQKALMDGDFPVTWADGFANYGLPTPLVSQQFTSYLGAVVNMLAHSPALTFKLLALASALVGGFTMYGFLRLYATPISAVVGTSLFSVTAYRISNLYVRGALPELWAMSLVPFVLWCLHQVGDKKPAAFMLLTFSLTLLLATHPFIFLLSFLITVPYALHLRLNLLRPCVAVGISLGLNAWYLFPLLLELKYFVISRNTTQLVADQFLTFSNYFTESWNYFSKNDVFVRANTIQFGLIETLVLVIGTLFLIRHRSRLLVFLIPTILVLVCMTTPASFFLYDKLPLLNGIQFPWRMFSILVILPPLVLALVIDSLPYRLPISMIVICLLGIVRFPQVYGKNFTVYPDSHYQKTIKNLHFDSLNTIWTGNTATYAVKDYKGEIIEGSGIIESRIEKNSQRNYTITAQTPVRLVDYTFYFPGWRIYVDGVEVPIEFQDVNYRGVITYLVPAGTHTIRVLFTPTKVRAAGYTISLITLVLSSLWGIKSIYESKLFVKKI